MATTPYLETFPPRPQGVEECFFHTREGAKIGGKIWGNPKGTDRVIALHGWLDNCNTWDPIMPLLLKNNPNLRVVAIDFGGHGHSSHRGLIPAVSTPQYLADVDDCVVALGWNRFILLGHSMGGVVAVFYAIARPKYVEKLICIDSFGPNAAPTEKAPELLTAWLDSRFTVISRQSRIYPTKEQLLQKFQESRSDMSAASLKILAERGVIEAPGGWRFRHDTSLKAPNAMRLTEEAIAVSLKRIECPTFVIFATSRTWTYDFDVHERMRNVRDCRFVLIEGGHHLHMEIPHTVEPHITQFILNKKSSL